ncbi:MAG: alanine racemase [Puniceicoccales bacterium]|jgi:alanine racemase|nr:alanine racemase [Puniceicoccales bacterium]
MRCWIEIDLTRFRDNIVIIKKSLPKGMGYISVVKANAYGCGAQELVKSSVDLVDAFAVANLNEAMAIKDYSQGKKILILGPLLSEEINSVVANGFVPLVSSCDELTQLVATAKALEKVAEIHLKIDTGMGRSGFWHENNSDELRRLCHSSQIKIGGLATHLSCLGSDNAYTELQRKNFRNWLRQFDWPTEELKIHESSSFAIKDSRVDDICNCVRVGAMQYGIAPDDIVQELDRLGIRPVLSFKSKLVLVKNIPKGVKIGYDGSYRTTSDTKIGVVACGYADGIPVSFINRGHCLVNGSVCQVIGRVSMDQTTICLANCPGPRPGDTVLWIGSDGARCITVNEFSKAGRRIIRESLCAISGRVERVYKR